jgi:hypothetical protein
MRNQMFVGKKTQNCLIFMEDCVKFGNDALSENMGV